MAAKTREERGNESMTRVFKISVLMVLLIAAAVAGVSAFGDWGAIEFKAKLFFNRPELPFRPDSEAHLPDYVDARFWAALPNREDLADIRPEGIENEFVLDDAPVDVFFIHPTGFLRGSSWTSTLDEDSATEENTHWMMANQASVYNGCCNVYAPRYRQASLHAFFSDTSVRSAVLDFAYQDIERAFQHFINHLNDGRPFVIASHSQGTFHAVRLIQDVIDNSPLAERMVVAFILGAGVSASAFDDLQDIGICENAEDLNCVVHWDTFNESVIDSKFPKRVNNICVNPLSWERDGGFVSRDHHRGAVLPSGEFNRSLTGSDVAMGVHFDEMAEPLVNLIGAQCKDGVLFISDQLGSELDNYTSRVIKGSYHLLDYPVFYMDIRENLKFRVGRYLVLQDHKSTELVSGLGH